MQKKKFQRKKEDFVCENCGQKNSGDGYTNHCFKCLYSKHVDVNPGDREADCGGLMEPIDTYQKDGVYYIKHKCLKCDFEKNNSVSRNDSFEKIIEISNKKD